MYKSFEQVKSEFDDCVYSSGIASPKTLVDKRKGNCQAATRAILHHITPDDRLFVIQNSPDQEPHAAAVSIGPDEGTLDIASMTSRGLYNHSRSVTEELNRMLCEPGFVFARYCYDDMGYSLDGGGIDVLFVRTDQVGTFFRVMGAAYTGYNGWQAAKQAADALLTYR